MPPMSNRVKADKIRVESDLFLSHKFVLYSVQEVLKDKSITLSVDELKTILVKRSLGRSIHNSLFRRILLMVQSTLQEKVMKSML